MANHSSFLSWTIPWTEEPGGLQSWGHKRVGHDLATKLSSLTHDCSAWHIVLIQSAPVGGLASYKLIQGPAEI